VDGGRTLHWSGKLGFIAGCTAVIDSHHAVMSTMGDRLALYRLPTLDPERQARAGLRMSGREKGARGELREAVAGLLAEARNREPAALSETETDRMAALATYACTGRSGVVRDGYSRELELVIGMEGPARLAKMLAVLLAGITALGATRAEAWEVVTKTAEDCIPSTRRVMLDTLAALEGPASTSALAEGAGYPTSTAQRALEELVIYGLATCTKGGAGKSHLWQISDLARDLRHRGTSPEMSVSPLSTTPNPATTDKSGEVGAGAAEPPQTLLDIVGKHPGADWPDDLEPGERGLS
jgi:hypothetical protein